MITLSHSTHATARLFTLKGLCDTHKKVVIMTDSSTDISLLRSFATIILGRAVMIIEDLTDFWMMEESESGCFCIPHTLLELQGKKHFLQKHSLFEIQTNQHISPESLIEKLIEFGYTHAQHPGEHGSYRREGSILTITDTHSGNIIHIEWFDTEIDSIIEIDCHTGTRSFRTSFTIKHQNIDTTPLKRDPGVLNEELFLSGIHGSHSQTDDGNKINDQSSSIHTTPITILIGGDFLPYIQFLRENIDIHYTDFHRDDAVSLSVDIPTISHIDELLVFLRESLAAGKKTVLYTKYAKTLREFIDFHHLDGIHLIEVTSLGLESFMIPSRSQVPAEVVKYTPDIVLTDDILGEIFVKKRNKKSLAKHLDLLLSLSPGDIVVHREHGIARFDKIIRKNTGNIEREYLELHYAEGDKLFVPLTEVYRVSKYLGNPDVTLTRLSGKEWEKTMEQTTEEIEAIAKDILETNARRSLAKGRSFAKFRDKESEFQKAFPYEYTLDQSRAIAEIFDDMESDAAMDRLISGDVGFGKTEVAMNALYKAFLSGTQVAVISPLLVLADEHFETFRERLSPFCVSVGIMTRMSTAKEITETLAGLKNGTIDVVVGTHRLLSEDVKFRKLGLLIIDEEHKFGVSHKERIKKIRAGIDILALSATPIPRSLNLALSGVKKISIIATPPKKKKPIETIITRWNESTIAHAIRYEIERGGQVIILHNRIRGMEILAREIESIIEQTYVHHTHTSPLPTTIITHGQMHGDEIEDRIHAFKRREYDVLISTTIIENGVNFLSANTIIIVDPEEFGLASLHQLRGRVGRKDIDGYCYLMYRKGELGPDEKERLITIANNTHLGAGFEIAMRDMEIRGAGDVLGIKQSGKSKDIGLTLYFRLLEERITELKESKKKRILPKIELDLSYTGDDTLFLSEKDKLNFFREIESLETLEELDELEEDFIRHGSDEIIHHSPPSHGLSNLFLLMRARIILSDYHITKLSRIGINYVFDLGDDVSVEDARRFLDRFDRRGRMILLSLKKIRTETGYWKSPQEFLEYIVL